MSTYHRNPTPSITRISLTTLNKQRLVEFYIRFLGLTLHHENETTAFLGTKTTILPELVEDPQATRNYQNTTGLYHFAFLYPNRKYLSNILRHLIQNKLNIQGASNHVISEAIYLSDPDGNSIELAVDTSPNLWPWKAGQLDIMSGQSALNIEDLLSHPTDGLSLFPDDTLLGHVHLHGSNLNASLLFYKEVLKMDLVIDLPNSAAFFSWGGYHHHLAVNLWRGKNIPLLSENTVGLREIEISGTKEWVEGLKKHSVSKDHTILVDPSNLKLLIKEY